MELNCALKQWVKSVEHFLIFISEWNLSEQVLLLSVDGTEIT